MENLTKRQWAIVIVLFTIVALMTMVVDNIDSLTIK